MAVEPVRHRFTVEEYYQMAASGFFAPDQRLELIDGEVIEMSPIGSHHAGTVNRLIRIFSGLSDRAVVAAQNPARLSDLSEPQPDITVLRWRPDFYSGAHPKPEDVLLLIEVSDSTISWDRRVKRPLYAAAGIPEMWIVDLGSNLLEVATEPGPDGYRSVRQVGPGHQVSPLALPDLIVSTADLLA